jgi:adenosylcobinamide kinase/adenosylcobinamide-phosphate guanylyltransferase
VKILVLGKANSGKSRLAEELTLKIATKKPYYIATYLDNFNDLQMQEKIKKHQKQRGDSFITIEEPFDISKLIKEDETYLIECLSMLIFNNLQNRNNLISQIKKTLQIKTNIIFVLNEPTFKKPPNDKESLVYLELFKQIKEILIPKCDEVYKR